MAQKKTKQVKNDKQVKIEDVLSQKEEKIEEIKQKPEVQSKLENKEEKAEIKETPKVSNSSVKKVSSKPKKTTTKKEKLVEPEIENINVENKNVKENNDNKNSKKENKIKTFFSKIFKKKEVEPVKIVRVKRVKTDANVGLSYDQVQERITKGQTNETPNQSVKTYKRIFFENIFTFFNLLCFAIAISLICVGAIQDCYFMIIILTNTAIGIIQEIRAKKTIEKLSLLTAPAVKVIRDRTEETITTDQVVIDDILVLSNGKQIVADSIIVDGAIEVNESMLTGESLPIKKKVGDQILAGSFVVSGTCKARVEKVGKNNYLQQLASKAKQYKKPKSELFSSLKFIIKIIGIIIVPVAILTYINTYSANHDIVTTIRNTAGSLIGMIPSGMFLLCSVALAVSVIKLARRKALVQDLYCVEMLARVNVLCLDKTGTITDGTMKVYNCIQLNETEYTLKRIVGSMLSALGDNNQTSQALINYFGYNKELKPVSTVPFSSSRKLSAVTFENAGTYIMGAPEFVIPNNQDKKIEDLVEQYSKDGYRVLMVAHSNSNIIKDNPPSNRTPIALLVLEDKIRDDAIPTIAWFKQNGVKVKIISGDNPLTVAEIAKRVGVENTESFINLEGLNEKQVIAAANKYTVFGRVTPEQKAILIKAIKSNGNTVAMTGDGVNDILALKEADCSIAMASGSEAVRSVSHMVLMNSDFGSMPETVMEGRRVINNVQKSSALFFMKTLFAITFSIICLFIRQPYPFKTFHMLLLETFVIGIPSFFLAFLPNDKPISGKFIYNLFINALPGALTLILNVGAVYIFTLVTTGAVDGASALVITTMGAITVTFTGLGLLIKLCKPWNVFTGVLFALMAICCFVGITVFYNFLQLSALLLEQKLFVVILIILAPTVITFMYKMFEKIKIA